MVVLPEVAPESLETVIEMEPLPWGGRESVVTAAGVALLDLLERA